MGDVLLFKRCQGCDFPLHISHLLVLDIEHQLLHLLRMSCLEVLNLLHISGMSNE